MIFLRIQYMGANINISASLDAYKNRSGLIQNNKRTITSINVLSSFDDRIIIKQITG